MKADLFQPWVADDAGQQPRCLQHELELELHHLCDQWRPGAAVPCREQMQGRVGVRGAPGAAACGARSWGGAAGLGARFGIPPGAPLGPGRARGGTWTPAVMRPRQDCCCCCPVLLPKWARGCPSTGLWPPGCRRVGWSWVPSTCCCWMPRARCSPGAWAGMDSWTTGPWKQSQSWGC